ncbi:hypothetical protein ACFUTX_12310 [Microbacterium sp. NPDC057407]|uniref:hypothetical protein n=1 Tax=Microbacterium sp. NPDC057407 TaxID=3346120 RepID=UPI00366E215D
MTDAMTDEEKRRDQLLAAPDATEADAAPRIDVTEHDGVTRIDIRDDAAVRPGNPEEDPDDDVAAGEEEHPSQAEGEDPDRPNTGEEPPEEGHPSQAEGDDPDRPDE